MRPLSLVPALLLATALTAAPLQVGLAPVVGGLEQPVEVVASHDGSGRLFIAEQGGRVRIFDGNRLLDRPFLDLPATVSCCANGGLLTPEVAGSSPVGRANLKHSPAANWAAFVFSVGRIESCNSQAHSQGRDSGTRKPPQKPRRKRATFHVSERVFHGRKRDDAAESGGDRGGTAAGVMRGRAPLSSLDVDLRLDVETVLLEPTT